jgi:hypothetical protein
VEGRADVIAGMDFVRWRPRVVVVEAVAPGRRSLGRLGAGTAGGGYRSRSSTA